MDKLAGRQPLVLLDVRPDEERLVSVMPGATHVTLTPAPAATWGYVLTGGAPAAAAVVREALATATGAELYILFVGNNNTVTPCRTVWSCRVRISAASHSSTLQATKQTASPTSRHFSHKSKNTAEQYCKIERDKRQMLLPAAAALLRGAIAPRTALRAIPLNRRENLPSPTLILRSGEVNISCTVLLGHSPCLTVRWN